jgi:hypothetical protein
MRSTSTKKCQQWRVSDFFPRHAAGELSKISGTAHNPVIGEGHLGHPTGQNTVRSRAVPQGSTG